jgi:endoglucanase
MKKFLILLLALLGAGLAQAKSPVETYGPLAISGNKLVDSAGKPVTLRGMSLFWHMHNGGKEFWRASVVKNVMLDWHASVIRAPIGVEKDGIQDGYLDNPTNAMMMARQVIDAAIENGIYVVVDYHAHQANSNRTAAKAFFKELSELYGNTPNIIWEIFNEPISDDWNAIVGYSNEIIPVIRKNSRNVILVPTSFYCQNLTEVDNQLSSKYSNLAYVLHFYAGSHSFRDRLATTMNKGYAVFVSEWGTTNANGNDNYSQSNSQAWLDEMDKLGISGCNWSLGNPLKNGVVETSAALLTGASQSGPWTDAEMSTSGKFVRNYLRTKNPTWTISDTTTRIATPLSASPTTATFAVDTVVISGGYNKVVPNWIMTLKGRTSGATFTINDANKSLVSLKWLAGKRDAGSAKWVSETVDVTVTPLNAKTSFNLVVPASSVQERSRGRVESATWKNTDLRMNLPVSSNDIGVLTIRDLSGREVWKTSASVDASGLLEVSTPALRGVHVVDFQAKAEHVRVTLTPGF